MNDRSAPDHWANKAKKQTYPARSVFKLEEIQKKWQPLIHNKAILDVGASPGSWTLYALRNFGKGSKVCAVDLKELTIQPPKGTKFHFLKTDVFSEEADAFLSRKGPFGCILSDAAPSTTGNRLVDTRRSYDLVMRVLDLAEHHLIDGGNIVVKVFQGGDSHEIFQRLRSQFENVKTFKPKAVRSGSMEIYMLGLGFLLRILRG